jgi:hypothetical protein
LEVFVSRAPEQTDNRIIEMTFICGFVFVWEAQKKRIRTGSAAEVSTVSLILGPPKL